MLVATKGGHLRPGDGSWTVDGRPEYLKQACEASLKRLGVDAIGLYQYHRPDPEVPYAESVGAIRDLLDEGKILMAGVSNANPEQIRMAQESSAAGCVSVQNQFSPRFRSSRARARALRPAGHRLPAVEPARRHRPAGDLGSQLRGVRGGGRGARRQPAAGHPGLDAREVARVIPIPGSSRPETILDSVPRWTCG